MSVKIERLRQRIRERVSEAILHELSDPRMGFVTVIGVDLTPDLRFAKVRVSILGDESEQRKIMRALEAARGRLQRLVAASLRTRTTPHLTIEHDKSIERSFRVSALLDEIAGERGDAPPEDAEAAGEAAEAEAEDEDEAEAEDEPDDSEPDDAEPADPEGDDDEES